MPWLLGPALSETRPKRPRRRLKIRDHTAPRAPPPGARQTASSINHPAALDRPSRAHGIAQSRNGSSAIGHDARTAPDLSGEFGSVRSLLGPTRHASREKRPDVKRIWRREAAEIRTFCTCRRGEIWNIPYGAVSAISGRSDGPATNFSNFGLLARFAGSNFARSERLFRDLMESPLIQRGEVLFQPLRMWGWCCSSRAGRPSPVYVGLFVIMGLANSGTYLASALWYYAAGYPRSRHSQVGLHQAASSLGKWLGASLAIRWMG